MKYTIIFGVMGAVINAFFIDDGSGIKYQSIVLVSFLTCFGISLDYFKNKYNKYNEDHKNS